MTCNASGRQAFKRRSCYVFHDVSLENGGGAIFSVLLLYLLLGLISLLQRNKRFSVQFPFL